MKEKGRGHRRRRNVIKTDGDARKGGGRKKGSNGM